MKERKKTNLFPGKLITHYKSRNKILNEEQKIAPKKLITIYTHNLT